MMLELIIKELIKQGPTSIVLAYILVQHSKTVKKLFGVIEKNTEAFVKLENKIDNTK